MKDAVYVYILLYVGLFGTADQNLLADTTAYVMVWNNELSISDESIEINLTLIAVHMFIGIRNVK